MENHHAIVDLAGAAQVLQNTSGRIVVLTHVKPDGDAFGSVLSLVTTLKRLGHQAEGCFVPPLSNGLKHLRGVKTIGVSNDLADYNNADLYVLVDTSAWSQIGPGAAVIKENLDKTLIIDHHLNGDIPAEYRHIDPHPGACCQIIMPIIEALLASQGGLANIEGEDGRIVREALFVGMATDTGWFRFSNTSADTHDMAGQLLAQGVDHAKIHLQTERMERPQKLALLTRALDSLRYFAEGQAAVMSLHRKDFEETGARDQETERIIDLPQQVGSVRVVALLSERANEDPAHHQKYYTRISFRSKSGENAVDVSKLAGQFGGGGHVRASGARLDGTIEKVRPQVIEALKQACQ